MTPEALRRVEKYPLGDLVLLHGPVSQALVLAAPAAVLQAESALAAEARGDALPEGISEILREWDRAGLFADSPVPFPGEVAWRRSKALPIRLSFGGRSVELAVEDAALRHDVALLAAPVVSDGAAGAESASRVDVLTEGTDFAVFRNGLPAFGRSDIFVARHVALSEVLVALHGAERVGCVLHAAAVSAPEGGGFVIAGESGAGKSTLATGLMARGWAQIADDQVGLDAEGRLLCFPTRVSLKEGSWPLAPPWPHVAGGIGGLSVRYLDPPRRVAGMRGLCARVLVFPRFEPGAETEVVRLAPEEALLRLVECGARLTGAAGAAPLVRLVASAPAYAVRHGGGSAAEEACEAILFRGSR